jgi:hypothetical protein
MNVYVVYDWYSLLCKKRHKNLYMFKECRPKYKGIYESYYIHPAS